MKRRFGIIIVMFVALLVYAAAWAEEENRLTRDEVAVVKKKLVAILSSLGDAPKGYVKEREDFNLPTQFYKDSNSGKIRPVYASALPSFQFAISPTSVRFQLASSSTSPQPCSPPQNGMCLSGDDFTKSSSISYEDIKKFLTDKSSFSKEDNVMDVDGISINKNHGQLYFYLPYIF